MRVLFFISDLLRNAELQHAFTKDPQRVMLEAGLSTEEQGAILARDGEVLATLVADAVRSLKPAPAIPWPMVGGQRIESVTPDQGVAGTSVTCKVTGTTMALSSESRDPRQAALFTCWLQLPDGTKVEGTKIENISTIQPWSFNVTFDLNVTVASATSCGIYIAYTGTTIDKPDAFTIQPA